MAKVENYTDLTIRWNGHQKYKTGKLLEDDVLEVVVQKLEMLLFTYKNEVLGQESVGFGVELERFLWQTKVSKDIIKGEVTQQINRWVPEMNLIGYDLAIDIFEGSFRDIMELNFTIKGQNVLFLFK